MVLDLQGKTHTMRAETMSNSTESPMVRKTICLPDDLSQRAEQRAARLMRSFSNYISVLVEQDTRPEPEAPRACDCERKEKQP